MVTLGSYPILEYVFGLVFVHLCPMWIHERGERFASSSLVCVKLYSMNEEKTKIASYVVMFSFRKRFYQQESLNCQPDYSLLFCVVIVIYLCC